MGRPVARNLEDEMMTKIKVLFDRILDTVNKENFVDCFDENDHFTKRVFEFLVKETAQRYRSAHPQLQHSSHPRTTIHHLPEGAQDSRSTTGTTTPTSNALTAGAETGAGGAGATGGEGGELIGATSAPSATALRQHHHHHHHHSPFQSSRHSLPALERDSLVRSPSTLAGFGSMNENTQATASSTSSSGAALRYLLSSQGFGQNSRRSRMAQRMLSNDLLAFHQGQPSLFSSLTSPMGSSSGAAGGASSSPALGSASTATSSTSPRVRSPFEQMQDRQDRLRRNMPLREFSMELMPESFRSTDSNASGSSFHVWDDMEPPNDPTVSRASSSSQRRRVIVAENMRQAREQQIRQMYAQTLRARPPLAQPSSTLTSSSQAQPSTSQASSSLSSEPTNSFQQHLHQQLQEQRARRQYDQLRQLEQSQHAHQQALQALQGQRLVAPEDTQQLSSSSQQDQPQSSTQSLPQRYVLQDNGLRLVQPYPGSPGTPVPLSSTASDSTATGGLTSQSTGSLSSLTSQQVLDEAYQEFSSSTERGRAAMRNALAADLHIEEDHQVLLTGEVSRRRRRRVVGRFSNSMGSPDIGSDNSSAIISQQQQQQEQREQESLDSAAAAVVAVAVAPTDSVSPLPPTSSTTAQQPHNVEQQQQGTVPVIDRALPTGATITTPSAATIGSTTTTAPTVPEVSVEMVDSQTTHDDTEHRGSSEISSSSGSSGSGGHLGLGLTSADSTSHGQSVPPTPPSPNPNRNPMPTFQDRRRSSINPADIETLVREMEANAQSAALGIRTTGSSSVGSNRPTSTLSTRIRFPLHALSPIVEPSGSAPPVPAVPPLGILTPTSSTSSLAGSTESGSRATQQPVLLSPEPEHGVERVDRPHSPPLQ
ncbi:hypothetical protein BG015_001100 [Linnemannia schmuckeri]|uniref:Uncharacterized protein n=1 Tax=Linnemannia schmuckeri TaxID=64567 RepID=A0A9P5RQQ4_9FUNG|nr:hypothetical protein BG015_001100 [Linnemannia schmuckeri]